MIFMLPDRNAFFLILYAFYDISFLSCEKSAYMRKMASECRAFIPIPIFFTHGAALLFAFYYYFR